MRFFKKEKDKNLEGIDWPSYIKKLNDENFDGFIEKYPICLIDFWAPWCQPCKKMTSRMRRLSKIFEKSVAFGKINIQKNKKIAKKYNIMSIPSLILFKYGKNKAFLTGVKSVGEIKKIIKKYL